MVLLAAIGPTVSVSSVLFDFHGSPEEILWLTLSVAAVLTFIQVVMILPYCYCKMIWIIFSSSSKLARLKRTADKDKVKSFELRIYWTIGVMLVTAITCVPDCIFLDITFSSSFLTIAGVTSLHLLEIMKHGIATIDQKEEVIVTELSTVPHPDQQSIAMNSYYSPESESK